MLEAGCQTESSCFLSGSTLLKINRRSGTVSVFRLEEALAHLKMLFKLALLAVAVAEECDEVGLLQKSSNALELDAELPDLTKILQAAQGPSAFREGVMAAARRLGQRHRQGD